MTWVLLAIAAAVAGAMAVPRGGRRARRRSGTLVHSPPTRAERGERPHRRVAHYRASGALPPWDP